MTHNISQTEASLALEAVQRRRDDVIAEIDVPRWYWPGMALGWAALGVLADYGPAWAAAVVTFAFGTAHAAIAPRVLSGRRASSRVSVRRDVVGRWIPAVIVLFLVAMTVITLGVALVFNADGARHPATLAGVVVAAVIIGAGPLLMRQVRARAQQR